MLGKVREVGPVATFAAEPVGDHAVGSGARRRAFAQSFDARMMRHTAQRWSGTQHALSGVTIVEFGYFYAMPFGVALAASLGARVIKLEGGDGDPMRHAFGGDAGSAKVMEGKESLSIDMKSPRRPHDRARADRARRRLRARLPSRRRSSGWASTTTTLSKINPKLVYVHAAGLRRARPVQPPTRVREHRARARREPRPATPASG